MTSPPFRIVILDDFLHDRQQRRPPGASHPGPLRSDAIRPFRIIQGDQYDRPGLVVHIERLLAGFVLVPGDSLFLAENGLTQGRYVDSA